MKQVEEAFDIVVCGGGLAGFSAAVAAARQGHQVCLIQDRPVFGGNSSSEIRVTPHGAAQFHAYARETGIISELLIEERAFNHEKVRENGWTNSVWDLVMYNMAVSTPGLTFHLNTSVQGAEVINGSIRAVRAVIANAETELMIQGKIFIDCTGDGIVADLAGCEWRWGSEGRDEFAEPHAPVHASKDTMGSSIHFRARNVGRPAPFRAPDWAIKHDNPAYFYEGGRSFYDMEAGYWWIEIGIPWNTIYDNETIRHELTRHTLGIWDWMKNHDPVLKEKTAHFALDWIGQVPGKRESRRIMGEYLMTEQDIQNPVEFPDEIAYGGWFLDLHTPGGLLAGHAEPASAENYSQTSDYAQKSYCGPYGIPFRIMVARDVSNLLVAGRNVSVTHVALGTVRVMATTALLGQAAGTGASAALKHGVQLRSLPDSPVMAIIQQQLLRDGCFLPHVQNQDALDIARKAKITASSSALIGGAEVVYRTEMPTEPLVQARGQWIAVSTDHIASVAVCLSNHSGTNQRVIASLVPVDHVWDYRLNTGTLLCEQELEVPPGTLQWIEWPANIELGELPSAYVRLQLSANPEVEWHTATSLIPGHTAAFDMGNGKMRRYRDGETLAYRIQPEQAVFRAEQVISGVTRPYQSTNLWMADTEGQPDAEAFIQLTWDTVQSIREVQLVFPGHLFREYHHTPPFYRAPCCARDIRIEAGTSGSWTMVAQVQDNYQRMVRIVLPEPVRTSTVRCVIEATNGKMPAAIYEVRCYS